MLSQRNGILSALALAALLTGRAFATDATNEIRFNRDIRPILSENCFRCHGPDKNQRKARMRLDVLDSALECKAFIPGKPAESELIKRIYSTKSDKIMPPPEAHMVLSAKQKSILTEWIAQGAVYEPNWAYIKLTRPAVPSVKNSAWVRNPIDAFILGSLEAKELHPSSEADKYTLLRRVSLDLTGLPPTMAEMDAFLKDNRPDAYERQVDRLLASPHYGERMAVPWLDAVRFADTVGYHGDQQQRIFPYRDYVINSFNSNKPFDQFTIEQIAGDLLPHPTAEQRIATGFNRLNMMTREGGAQPKEYLAKYAADRVRTIAGAWLGSTMGCCECHDHKFDPFSTKDFYQMESFFADIKQWGYYDGDDIPEFMGTDNNTPFPPEIEVSNRFLARHLASLHEEISERVTAVDKKRTAKEKTVFDQWRRENRAFLKNHPDGWVTPPVVIQLSGKKSGSKTSTASKTNAVAKVNDDRSISLPNMQKKTEVVLTLETGWIAAIRVERIPSTPEKQKNGMPSKTTINFSASLKPQPGAPAIPMEFSIADANHKWDHYFNGYALPGILDEGWRIYPQEYEMPQAGFWMLKKPIKAQKGQKLVLRFNETAATRVRVSVSPFAAVDPLNAGTQPELSKALSKWPLFRTRANQRLLGTVYLLSTGWNAPALETVRELQDEALAMNRGKTWSMVTEAQKPYQMRVLPRGNWQSTDGEIVHPGVPHFLPQPSNPENRRLTRLDLARWLVSKDNPLTARVIMNRLWKQYFGTAISAYVDDLGSQGEWPVHPELLDWLASEFEDSGWNWKHMARLIVTSATYRQESDFRLKAREIDPNNRLLSCQSPRRLDAEFVRDNALAIAGLLNLEIGGPSTHPYQPEGYYANLQFPDRVYHADTDDQQYRRGVYIHWQRTFLQPMLAAFDAPSREECICTRNLSNTPQQALTLLNDPTFVEAARVLAQDLLFSTAKSDSARLDYIYERALARPIKPQEADSLEKFLVKQRDYYDANADDAAKLMKVGDAPTPKNLDQKELAAWTSVCRVVLNLHESITVY